MTIALPFVHRTCSTLCANFGYGSVRGALSNERPYRDRTRVG